MTDEDKEPTADDWIEALTEEDWADLNTPEEERSPDFPRGRPANAKDSGSR